jgi:hypothetical protein
MITREVRRIRKLGQLNWYRVEYVIISKGETLHTEMDVKARDELAAYQEFRRITAPYTDDLR